MFNRTERPNIGKYCIDCKERYPTCQDKCEKIKKAREEHLRNSLKRKEQFLLDNEYMSYLAQRNRTRKGK